MWQPTCWRTKYVGVGLQYSHVSSTVFYFILIKNAIRISQNSKDVLGMNLDVWNPHVCSLLTKTRFCDSTQNLETEIQSFVTTHPVSFLSLYNTH